MSCMRCVCVLMSALPFWAFVCFNSDILSSITYLSPLVNACKPLSSSNSPKSVVHSFRATTANVCLSFWQTRSGVNNRLLIRLFVQQERASVNASCSCVPTSEFKSGNFHKNVATHNGEGSKAEIYISCGLRATLGNAWVTFSFFMPHREQICSFLKNFRTDWMKTWKAKGGDTSNEETKRNNKLS